MLKKWRRAAGIILILNLAAGCSVFEPRKESSRAERGIDTFQSAESGGGEQAGKSLPTALEQFGRYLGTLLTEGRWTELDQHIISRPIEWEEAADMAELDPAFEHFVLYGEHRANSDDMLMAEADVNGDGIMDIIEYQPRVGTYRIGIYQQYSLAIYAGRPEGGFEVMYSRPYLDAYALYLGRLAVAEYEGGIFMIVEYYDSWNPHIVNIYQIGRGGLSGKLRIDYKNTGIDVETVYCRSGMEAKAEELCMKAEEYYKTLQRLPESIAGDAEKVLEEKTEIYARLKRIDEERREEYMDRYREDSRGNRYSFGTCLCDLKPEAYQSDIDNDGEMETYAKRNDVLGRIGMGNSNIYKTGELYGNGRHEGRWGLDYVMENGGERTDFETLCGLDIWLEKDTPQTFWVDRCGEENITFIEYADREYMGIRIEGYCIRDGGYERVLSVEYRPRTVCTFQYDRRKGNWDGGVLSYAVNMVPRRDMRYPKIWGMEDEELQEKINIGLEVKLGEKIDGLFSEHQSPVYVGSSFNVESASEEFLVLLYTLGYHYEGWERGWIKYIYIGINLRNGEIEFYEDYDNEMAPGW